MRKSILLAVLLMVTLVAVPAFASVQNVKVSGDIDSTYLYRRNFDFGAGAGAEQFQSLFITQSTLDVNADLSDNVAATLGLINERVWENNAGGDSSSRVNIYKAYVTLREMLYSPLTVVIGRQPFSYGNSFIFDTNGPNNGAVNDSALKNVAGDLTKQSGLDAIRAILDYNPLKIETVFAVIHPGSTTRADSKTENYLYGTNATYQVGDSMKSVVESYLWYRVDKTLNEDTGRGAKTDVLKIVGIRGSTNPIEGLNLQAEFAYQSGNKVVSGTNNARRRAFGVQAIVNYQVPVLKEYKPVAQYVFTKVTGEAEASNGGDATGDYTGWDPFFENQAGGTIYNSIFNLTDAIIHTLSVSANPMKDVTTKLSLTGLWLERFNKNGTFSVANGAITQPDLTATSLTNLRTGRNATFLGKEVDFDVTYDYTEDVKIGTSLGWFFPRTIFDSSISHDIHSNAAKQVIAHVNVAF